MARQLQAFVSCSFRGFKDRDDPNKVTGPLKELIRHCGMKPVALNWDVEAGRSSEVIVETLKKCGLFIAVVTKRDKLKKSDSDRQNGDGNYFRTSALVIQEIGIACALNKEIVVFIEKGVRARDLGMAEDRTRIEFDSDSLGYVSKYIADRGKTSKRANLGKESHRTIETMRTLLESAKQRCLSASPVIDDYQVAVETTASSKKRLRRTLTVRQLADVGPWMSGPTFFQGLEYLYRQMREEPSEFRPDIFVGINSTGLMIASYLNGRIFGKDQRPVFPVFTGAYKASAKRQIDYRWIRNPDADVNGPTVLVIDSQIKRGQTAQKVIRRLKKQWGKRYSATLFYASLVACGVNPDKRDQKAKKKKGKTAGRKKDKPAGGKNGIPRLETNRLITMTELFRDYFVHRDEGVELAHPPDFLAYISASHVKPPEGIP